MEDEAFEEHVRAALDSLPDELAARPRERRGRDRGREPGGPGILGSFFGYPHGDRTPPGALPARIVIYRLPLEEAFPDPDELEREIRVTVLHELAHYFGIDEDRIAELGYS